MKKILLFFALTMFAVIGRSQSRPNSYQAYLDTLNMTYTGPLLAHQLHVIAMMVGIMPYTYDRYYDKSKFLEAFYDYPLVSSFISRVADEVGKYVEENAVFVEDMDYGGNTVPGCSVSGTTFFSEITLFPMDESAIRNVADSYVELMLKLRFPEKFDFDLSPVLGNVKMRNKAKEALECGSLRKVCSQNGFYDENLACNVVVYICASEMVSHLVRNGNYGEKAMLVFDNSNMAVLLAIKGEGTFQDALSNGAYSAKLKEWRKKILSLFN